MPLPIRCLFTRKISGDISPQLIEFIYYIPGALLVQSIFFMCFSFFYCCALRNAGKKNLKIVRFQYLSGRTFLLAWLIIFIISLLMLRELASNAGGILPMILSGYGVTEQFIGRNHLAIAFDWLSGLSVLLFSFALSKKSKFWILNALGLIIILSICYGIMGRRAALVVLGVAVMVLIHFCYRELKLREIVAALFLGFLVLNLIGLIRGGAYENLENMIEVIFEKNEKNQEEYSNNIFYTLTEGNFAVPFETLPQIMSRWGDTIAPRIGLTFVHGAALLIPNAIWEDRPLPLSNWYMREFYEINTPMNEGRQFYFLSESYLNFGLMGAVFWGLILGYGFLKILISFEKRKCNSFSLAFFSIAIGNLLNFVSSDLIGGLLAFLKGIAFPIIILYLTVLLVNRIRNF